MDPRYLFVGCPPAGTTKYNPKSAQGGLLGFYRGAVAWAANRYGVDLRLSNFGELFLPLCSDFVKAHPWPRLAQLPCFLDDSFMSESLPLCFPMCVGPISVV